MSVELSMDIRLRIGVLDIHAVLPPASGMTIIIGTNGAGKTTLLRALLGDLTPSEGQITLGDVTLFSSDKGIEVPIEHRRLGYVPQRYALFPHLTVAANVGFGLRTMDPEAREKRVTALLEDFDIKHLADRKPPGLSGGESQRVALARALAIEPRAVLLDEPMGALDATARRRVRKVLAERLNSLEIPTVVVTHDAADVVALGGRVAVVEAGKIVQIGSVEELVANPASEFVQELLGDNN